MLEKKWYVVYTKPRWEKKIAAALEKKEIEHYCPLNKIEKQWSDRKKIIEVPLFKGYVFVCPETKNKWDLKMVDGILNYVYWLGKPAVVKNSEIDNIRKFLNEFDEVEVNNLDAGINENVEVKKGVLMNYKGIIVEIFGNKAKVKLESMGIAITAIIERSNLEKCII
ncbi:MAG: UpxY family transcription antiterminator [Ferruginibacter sp.]|nr:UpxY family transcription antiterminator [Ferruginibacter sp.]